jgi:hypothetical protein
LDTKLIAPVLNDKANNVWRTLLHAGSVTWRGSSISTKEEACKSLADGGIRKLIEEE